MSTEHNNPPKGDESPDAPLFVGGDSAGIELLPPASAATGTINEEQNAAGEKCFVFHATLEELKLLAKHHAKDHLQWDLFVAVTSQVSGVWRWQCYANSRLREIELSAGEQIVQDAIEAVRAETRRSLGPELWERFCHGDWDAMAEEAHAQEAYLGRKLADGETLTKAFEFLRENPCRLFFDDEGDLWLLTQGPPDSTEADTEWLEMTVRTHYGAIAHTYNYRVPRPANWKPPFGIEGLC